MANFELPYPAVLCFTYARSVLVVVYAWPIFVSFLLHP